MWGFMDAPLPQLDDFSCPSKKPIREPRTISAYRQREGQAPPGGDQPFGVSQEPLQTPSHAPRHGGRRHDRSRPDCQCPSRKQQLETKQDCHENHQRRRYAAGQTRIPSGQGVCRGAPSFVADRAGDRDPRRRVRISRPPGTQTHLPHPLDHPVVCGGQPAGLRYSEFIHLLSTAQITLDRRIMADMAVRDAEPCATGRNRQRSHPRLSCRSLISWPNWRRWPGRQPPPWPRRRIPRRWRRPEWPISAPERPDQGRPKGLGEVRRPTSRPRASDSTRSRARSSRPWPQPTARLAAGGPSAGDGRDSTRPCPAFACSWATAPLHADHRRAQRHHGPAGVHGGRGARGRGRVAQFRGPQHPAGPSGPRPAGKFLPGHGGQWRTAERRAPRRLASRPLLLLRSQTSTVQIRVMEKTRPPVRIISRGPGVSARHGRRHPLPDVPPDRGPAGRSRG